MPNEQYSVPHTCGCNKVLNTRDAKDAAHFKQMIKTVTNTLCDICLRTIEKSQSDKGSWKL